jgi:hypothetical protein
VSPQPGKNHLLLWTGGAWRVGVKRHWFSDELITIAVSATAGIGAIAVGWTPWEKGMAAPCKMATKSMLGAKDTCAMLAQVMGISTHFFQDAMVEGSPQHFAG